MGVLLTTLEGEMLRANVAARELLGILTGKTVDELSPSIVEIDPRLGSALGEQNGELSVRLKDGSQRFVRFFAETHGRSCDGCEIKDSGEIRFCRVAKGRGHRSEKGTWPEACLACRLFLSRNLTPFLHSCCL